MTTEGGCRRTTTEGGVVVGRQQGGAVVGRQQGGEVGIFFGQNRKNGPEILVKRAVSCCMYLVQNSKMAKKILSTSPPCCRPTPYVVIPQLDQMTNFVYRENGLQS